MLELSKLTRQVTELGRTAAAYAGQVAEAQDSALQQLTAANEQPDLLAKVEFVQKNPRLAGLFRLALPTDEPIDNAYALPATQHPARATVIGSDGSHVEPDIHGIAPYSLINIGSILYRHGSGQAPLVDSQPLLRFDAPTTPDEMLGRVQSYDLRLQRDIAEMARLAELVEQAEDEWVAALRDGPLALFVLRETGSTATADRIAEYTRHFERIAATGGVVGGFINRSTSRSVVNLLFLSTLEMSQINEEALHRHPWPALRDQDLFATLHPGQRSAIFRKPAAWDEDRFYGRHRIYFTYMNVGGPGRGTVARIEVPEWVAHSPHHLDWLRLAIYEQCKATNGYPYVLARAHELAVVDNAARRQLEQMVAASLARHAQPIAVSAKEANKALTGFGKRALDT